MRLYIWNKAWYLTALLALTSPLATAATMTKTVSMPTSQVLVKQGTGTSVGDALSIVQKVGEYIPSSQSTGKALTTLEKGVRIPVSGISTVLKEGLKVNPAQIAVGVGMAVAFDALDWLFKDGVMVKKIDADANTGLKVIYNDSYRGNCSGADQLGEGLVVTNAGWAYVIASSPYESNGYTYSNNCAPLYVSQKSYQVGDVVETTTYSPLVDSDYTLLDNFIKGEDGVWQQQIVDEVCSASDDYEGCVKSMGGTQTLTGPSTVQAPTVTTSSTKTNSDGTSTVTTTNTDTSYDLNYDDIPNIAIDPTTTTTTTTTQKDATGNTTSTQTSTDTTTTTTEGEGEDTTEYTYQDKDLPQVDPFYTQKYPDGFSGVWKDHVSSFENSAFIEFLRGFVPSFSGSCPSFGLSFNIMANANYGYVGFSDLCYIFDFVKVLMLVTAMFTCRALIFGG